MTLHVDVDRMLELLYELLVAKNLDDVQRAKICDEAASYFRRLAIRRKKEGVDLGLPSKKVVVRYVTLSPEQQALYRPASRKIEAHVRVM